MANDYYFILGIPRDATDQEIKSAYRRRARKLHPDRSGKDSGPFRDVQEAYSVLSDPKSRRRYDRRRTPRQSKPFDATEAEPLVPELEPAEPLVSETPAYDADGISLADSFETYRPSFEELFERLARNFGIAEKPKSEHLEQLNVEITLSPEQARRGGAYLINVPVHAPCPLCRGTGEIGAFECLRCSGQGTVSGDCPIETRWPPFTRSGHAVSISLEHLGIRNLYMTVHFRVSRFVS